MKYLKHTIITLIGCIALAFTSCEGEEKFEIKGEVAGNPTMNLYLKYYGNESVRTGVTAVQNGKFEYTGNSKQPTIVYIMDNEYHVLGQVYLKNGESVNVKLDRRNPYLINASGTQINEAWSSAVNQYADSLFNGSPYSANQLIEDYISEHPDKLVSTLLFVTAYNASVDPQRADSVLQSIDPEVRIGRLIDNFVTPVSPFATIESLSPIDSLVFRTSTSNDSYLFDPKETEATVIALTIDKSQRDDTVMDALKEIHAMKDVRVVDLMLTPDTAAWRRVIRNDSVKWLQGWLPGGLFAKGIDRLAIPHLPYYFVIDSLGNQIYRGPSILRAKNTITYLKSK